VNGMGIKCGKEGHSYNDVRKGKRGDSGFKDI
jgi:hypothetical protein